MGSAQTARLTHTSTGRRCSLRRLWSQTLSLTGVPETAARSTAIRPVPGLTVGDRGAERAPSPLDPRSWRAPRRDAGRRGRAPPRRSRPGRPRAAVTPYLIETEPQLACAANEAEALQVVQAVTTVTGNRASRRREETDAPVIAYGLDVDVGGPRQLADPETCRVQRGCAGHCFDTGACRTPTPASTPPFRKDNPARSPRAFPARSSV